jgi:hypothetical protein
MVATDAQRGRPRTLEFPLSFSSQFGRERAATANFAGTLEGEIVDLETSEARFARGANYVFDLSWPQP